MLFAPDTVASLEFAVTLINTGVDETDDLQSVADLTALLDAHSFTGVRAGTPAELDAVRTTRGELDAIWRSDVPDGVAMTNDMMKRYRALPQLATHPEYPDWHIHATVPTDPLHQRIAVEAAMAFVDIYRAGEERRLKTCAGTDCSAAVIDLSRNGSKRFCDTGNCANREHVAAYRRRQRA